MTDDKQPTETCGTCGSRVRVEGGTTKYYVPVGDDKEKSFEEVLKVLKVLKVVEDALSPFHSRICKAGQGPYPPFSCSVCFALGEIRRLSSEEGGANDRR